MKGTFYIPQTCDLVSKSLSENQIRDLSNLVEIGGHTISHQVLTHTTYERARLEIYNCKSWLENITGKSVQSFCPPTGRFNRHHVSLQQEAGFRSMRTVEMLSYSLRQIKKLNDFVVLPTTSQVYNHTNMAYLKNCTKRLKFGNYPAFLKLFDSDWEAMSKNYITWLNKISEGKSVEYYFHLWGHSWEIEKYSLWNSLERVFKDMSGIEDLIVCDNSELAEIVRSGKRDD